MVQRMLSIPCISNRLISTHVLIDVPKCNGKMWFHSTSMSGIMCCDTCGSETTYGDQMERI